MAILGSKINEVEQFISDYMKVNIADAYISGIPVIILPKFSEAKGEFIAILLKTVDEEVLDSADLNYDIIIRLARVRENLLDIRNTVIGLFSSIATDMETEANGAGNIVFKFERSDAINFELDDDYYDIIFSISSLV